MRYELRRRLDAVIRCLRVLGEDENALTLERRVADGTLPAWLHGDHGTHVWAEVDAIARYASREANLYTELRSYAARALNVAFREAETWLADELPRPARIPTANLIDITERLEHVAVEGSRPTLRLIQGGATEPTRAA